MTRSFGDEVAARVGVIAEPGNLVIFYFCRNIGARFMQRWQVYSIGIRWSVGIPLKWRCRLNSIAIFREKKCWRSSRGTCERKLFEMEARRRWYYRWYNMRNNISRCKTTLTVATGSMKLRSMTDKNLNSINGFILLFYSH